MRSPLRTNEILLHRLRAHRTLSCALVVKSTLSLCAVSCAFAAKHVKTYSLCALSCALVVIYIIFIRPQLRAPCNLHYLYALSVAGSCNSIFYLHAHSVARTLYNLCALNYALVKIYNACWGRRIHEPHPPPADFFAGGQNFLRYSTHLISDFWKISVGSCAGLSLSEAFCWLSLLSFLCPLLP